MNHAARQVFRSYLRWKLPRGLDGVFVRGLDEAAAQMLTEPVVFALTHSSWWDGLVVAALDGRMGGDGRLLVKAESLTRLPFFRLAGAIPIDGFKGLRAAAKHAAPGKAVWLFPQGRQRPTHLRPLQLRRGWEALARLAKASVVPVSMAYGFRDQPVPSCFLDFGRPTSDLEGELIAGLEDIDRQLDGQDMGFHPLFEGKAPNPELGLGVRLLGGQSEVNDV